VIADPAGWQRAVADMEQTVERLKAIPASDLVSWRDAARGAAGVYAALSRRLEGDCPGPIAKLSDTLARSAQHRPSDLEPNRSAMGGLRGMAAIAAPTHRGVDSPVAWAMLLSQMGRTLDAISDAHASRGEVEMARALVDSLATEIDILHDGFATWTSGEVVLTDRPFQARVATRWSEGTAATLEIEEDLDLEIDDSLDFGH
jgi:hypothetical protein